jgi:phosphoribosylamine--glycine ligase
MNVLVVGGGGREHAICLALSKSKRVDRLYCAPGNGGISEVAECVGIRATDMSGIVAFAKTNPVDFVMVAPDDPLALGLVDALEAAGLRAFGPRANAAILESSKAFSKSLMKKYGIPTAAYEVFTDYAAAEAYIREKGAPIVVKADGLALGKGVVVAQDVGTALDALKSMMRDNKFGDSGRTVVIEEFMTGPEVTVLAFTDGKTVVPMLSSQDHKRAFDGDEGPNTGGMGAVAPRPHETPELADVCMKTIFRPTIEAMNSEGRAFKGVIYFGLMLTPAGPRVVEYNARFGDPEAQPLLSMLETDLLDIFEAVVDGRLEDIEIKWRPGAACCVVMASGGYPVAYEKGYEVTGLDAVPPDITVYHAGTAKKDGRVLTSGGRVRGVTALGPTLDAAVRRAYEGVGLIRFKDAHYRTDIGRR